MRYSIDMKSLNHEQKKLYLIFSIIAVLFIVIGLYSVLRTNSLSSRINALNANLTSLTTNLASTTEKLQATIDSTKTSLSSAISTQQQNVGAIQQQLGGFQNQVGNLSGTLNTLQKLSKTDPELLRKYSKVYFLNENYVPPRLSEIPLSQQYSNKKQLLIHTDVMPHLLSMIDTASSTGIKIYAFSAYRSYPEQKALKNEYSITYGAGTANSFSADQGYSEHQLGTTVDIITPGLGGVLDGFDKTPASKWMLDNAYKYGFVLSYPEKNSYYVYEPWHWRFVGTKLAKDLRDQNKNFYDLDQRTIDGYLVNVFD